MDDYARDTFASCCKPCHSPTVQPALAADRLSKLEMALLYNPDSVPEPKHRLKSDIIIDNKILAFAFVVAR